MNHRIETIKLIKDSKNSVAIELLSNLPDKVLEDLYHEWSEVTYSASWVHATEGAINQFIKWATTAPYVRAVDECLKIS